MDKQDHRQSEPVRHLPRAPRRAGLHAEPCHPRAARAKLRVAPHAGGLGRLRVAIGRARKTQEKVVSDVIRTYSNLNNEGEVNKI